MTKVMARAIRPSSINWDVMSNSVVTDKKYGEMIPPNEMLPNSNINSNSSVPLCASNPRRLPLDTAYRPPRRLPANGCIRRHGGQNNAAFNSPLPEARYTGHGQGIGNGAQQQRAEQCAYDAASSTQNARPADDRGGDYLQLERDTGRRRVHRRKPSRIKHTGQTGQHT